MFDMSEKLKCENVNNACTYGWLAADKTMTDSTNNDIMMLPCT